MKIKLICTLLFFQAFSMYAQDYLPGYVIVKFKETPSVVINQQGKVEIPALSSIKGGDDMEVSRQLFAFLSNNQKGLVSEFQNIYSLSFDPNIPVTEKLEALRETGLFDYIEPEYLGTSGGQRMEHPPVVLEPNDAFFFRQWNMLNDGSFNQGNPKVDADTDMDLAWETTTGSEDVTIAILDSGLKLDHPEMAGRLWENQGEIAGNGIDDDNNGFVDDINGWDFVNNDNNPTDDHGHGTNVTGIAAATGNNNIGYAGVDWHAKVMVLKILNANNSGLLSVWAEAVMYAAMEGANVMNMSVGGSGNSTPLRNACDFAYNDGVTIVACMMNFNNITTYYPAGYNSTIAVGSTDMDDTRTEPFFWSSTSGSNYGNHIDVVAPGNYIYGLNYNSNTNYGSYWGGTSQATPLVAGLCGLLLAEHPTLTPEEIRALIQGGAEDGVGDSQDTPGFDIYYGHGRVNAYNTLLGSFTNTKNLKTAIHFEAYPNPVNRGEMTLLDLPENEMIKSVQMVDMAGKCLLSKEINQTGQYRLLIPAEIPQGLYLVELFGSEKTYYAKIQVR